MRAEDAIKHEGDGETNCSWCTWNDPKKSVVGQED